ncbi:hypothetical protein PHISP_03871 [Aspergillus sp. HF37]|nr:hypothetical protein PHISP_03871 [Aspergillus sp. HF37]
MRALRSPVSLSSWASSAFRRRVALTDPCRKFHGSLSRASNSDVFPDDLQKTLDAHRSTNRASIIRRVFPKTPRKDASHPVVPVEDNAGGKTNEHSVEEPSQPAEPVNAPNVEENRSPRKPTRKRLQQPRTSLLQLGPWSVDEVEGRPEQSPWLDHMDPEIKRADAVSHLDAEIRALERYMLPTPREHPKVNQLVAGVTNHLAGVVPHPPLVIGSRRTGFASSHSNLDLILPVDDVERSVDRAQDPRPSRPRMRDIRLDFLNKVANTLEQSPMFNRVHMPKRIPLVTAVHSPTDLQLQLSCGEGLPSSVEYISSYVSEYPAVRPLYMATRVILEAQGMLGAHTSSVRSSALLMLLVTFLKMNHGRFNRPETLGEQLLAILHTYGSTVDLKSTGVSVDPPGFFNSDSLEQGGGGVCDSEVPSAQLRGQQSLLNLKHTAAKRRNFPTARRLCIQDPSNYMVDLGRSCTRTAELQNTFADAYCRLQDSLDSWDPSAHSSTATRPSVLSHALKANFDDFEARRIRLAFGSDQ